MTRNRLDRVVPVRDRRQRRRILTLRNFAFAVAIAIAAFAGITIESNLRRSAGKSGFGNLYGRQLPAETVTRTGGLEVVIEASVPDANAADPMLVGASSREQLLRADSNVPAPEVPAEPPQPLVRTATGTVDGDSHVAIVGGTGGVTIVKESQKPPVLGGGFGRE